HHPSLCPHFRSAQLRPDSAHLRRGFDGSAGLSRGREGDRGTRYHHYRATGRRREGELMSEKRRGLGRGIGALIPSAPPEGEATDSGQQAGTAATATIARPVDVFFSGSGSAESADDPAANESPEQTSSGRSENRSARSLMEPGQKRSKSKAGSKASGTRSNRGRASAANTAAADADDDADGSTEQVGTPTEKAAAPSRKKAATGRRTAASSSSGHDSSGHDSSGHDATDDTSA